MKTLQPQTHEIGAPNDAVRIMPSALQTPADWLNALMQAKDLPSDYALAKKYKLSRGRVSNYRTGKNAFDDGMSMLLERELNLPKGTVATWAKAYNATDFVSRQYWTDIKNLLSRAALVCLSLSLCLSFFGTPQNAQAAPLSPQNQTTSAPNDSGIIYIMSTRIRRFCAGLLALFLPLPCYVY